MLTAARCLSTLLGLPFPILQDVTPLVQEGDLVGPHETVLNLDRATVDDQGRWRASVITSHPEYGRRSALLVVGQPAVHGGDAVPEAPGARYDDLDPIPGPVAGTFFTIDDHDEFHGPWYLRVDGELLAAKGRDLGAPSMPGAAWHGSPRPIVNARGQAALAGSVFDGATYPTILGVVEAHGTRVVLRKGELLPGQALPILHIGIDPALDGQGVPLSQVGFGHDWPVVKRALYRGRDLFLDTGDPAPLPGWTWAGAWYGLSAGEHGEVGYSGVATDGTTLERFVVHDGELIARSGEALPEIAPHVLQHQLEPARRGSTLAGELIWSATWGPDEWSPDNTGVFAGRRLVLGTGDLVGGAPLTGAECLDVSPTGRFLIVQSATELGQPGFYLVDRAVGESYCSDGVQVNSSGQPAEIQAIGPAESAGGTIILTGTRLPTHTQSIFLVARDAGSSPGFGGGVGTLCLGGPMGWFPANSSSGALGSVAEQVDLAPLPLGGHTVQAGETWRFQLWYRDGPTSNLTDAISVTFH